MLAILTALLSPTLRTYKEGQGMFFLHTAISTTNMFLSPVLSRVLLTWIQTSVFRSLQCSWVVLSRMPQARTRSLIAIHVVKNKNLPVNSSPFYITKNQAHVLSRGRSPIHLLPLPQSHGLSPSVKRSPRNGLPK